MGIFVEIYNLIKFLYCNLISKVESQLLIGHQAVQRYSPLTSYNAHQKQCSYHLKFKLQFTNTRTYTKENIQHAPR